MKEMLHSPINPQSAALNQKRAKVLKVDNKGFSRGPMCQLLTYPFRITRHSAHNLGVIMESKAHKTYFSLHIFQIGGKVGGQATMQTRSSAKKKPDTPRPTSSTTAPPPTKAPKSRGDAGCCACCCTGSKTRRNCLSVCKFTVPSCPPACPLSRQLSHSVLAFYDFFPYVPSLFQVQPQHFFVYA